MTSSDVVRDATDEDWAGVWPIVRDTAAAGETFPYELDLDETATRATWLRPAAGRCSVAVDPAGVVVGTASMGANRGGPGDHVASASYMVDARHTGRGTGRALVRDSLAWAAGQGFAAMVFNAVVETNTPAVALYLSEGFTIVGTVPGSFRHPRHGLVGLHVLHRLV